MTARSIQGQIDDLFARVVALPAEERSAFLKSTCDGDANILAEVQKLLAAHDRAEQATEFLAEPPDDLRLFPDDDERKHPLVGQRIGPYEVKRWLGGGGFGHVYLAFRSDDYRQKVAVKVLRSDIEVDDRILARFELELQLLADLQHEHIARLLYGGTLDTGRPYIVMEYVKGKPITEYCDSKRISVAERLALFRQVCEAVAYAHRFGAIHRDIKPGNIFVAEDGNVKLLDFGIAKMVDPISQRRMVTISEGGMPLTPEYASPEQVRGEGISTASDVYSLGVVLYELLTGRRPYDFRRFTAAEIERVICEEEPRKPSNVVLEPHCIRRDNSADEVRSSQSLAEPRSTDPQKLNRTLKGDLEQIVLMALRKVPQRRYQNVEALVQDLDRYKLGQTIVARPISRMERAVRWCKRRPTTAALLGLLLFVAVVGPIVGLQQSRLRNRADQLLITKEHALAQLEEKNDELNNQLVRNLIERGSAQSEAGNMSQAIALFTRAYLTARSENPLRTSARNLVAVWSAKTRLTTSLVHDDTVFRAAFSADGRTVFTQGSGAARLWDAVTGKPLGEPLRYEGSVLAMAFSSNGIKLLTGGRTTTTQLWNATTGMRLGELLPQKSRTDAVFSPSGETVFTTTYDGTSRLWDAVTGKPLGEPLRYEGSVLAMAFSPSGTKLLTGSWDKTVRLWSAATGKPLGEPMRHDDRVTNVTFSPDSKTILTGSDDATARLWDAATGKPLGKTMRHDGRVTAVAFSPDGRMVLTESRARTARLWDAATGKPLGEIMRHEDQIADVAFSPDGRMVLTASGDKTARLWDVATGKPLGEPMRHDDRVIAVAFSPDGRKVATGSLDQTARLWDAATGKPLGEPLRHDEPVTFVAFDRDGHSMITASDGSPMRRWDAETAELKGSTVSPYYSDGTAAFSPDGGIVLTSNRGTTARLWSAATGKPLGELIKHGEKITDMDFAPDGCMLLTGSHDNTARLWDTATGKPLGEPLRHDDSVFDIAFSPDGRTVLTASGDKIARLWSIPQLPDNPELIRNWSAVKTGMVLDDEGLLRRLSRAEWVKARDELEKLRGNQKLP